MSPEKSGLRLSRGKAKRGGNISPLIPAKVCSCTQHRFRPCPPRGPHKTPSSVGPSYPVLVLFPLTEQILNGIQLVLGIVDRTPLQRGILVQKRQSLRCQTKRSPSLVDD